MGSQVTSGLEIQFRILQKKESQTIIHLSFLEGPYLADS